MSNRASLNHNNIIPTIQPLKAMPQSYHEGPLTHKERSSCIFHVKHAKYLHSHWHNMSATKNTTNNNDNGITEESHCETAVTITQRQNVNKREEKNGNNCKIMYNFIAPELLESQSKLTSGLHSRNDSSWRAQYTINTIRTEKREEEKKNWHKIHTYRPTAILII